MTASPAPRPRPVLGALAVLVCVGGLAGCGGDGATIEDASDGRPFAISARATFPERQRLAELEALRITVRNADSRPLPNVAVVLTGLTREIGVADNGAGRTADPRRPVWIVDGPPKGASTAFAGTAALGRLAPGASRTFVWKLTPAIAGRHVLRWRATAAIDDDGPVRAAGGGGATSGRLPVRVAD